MNIELTDDEYEKLLGLLYIAEQVLTGHKAGDDPRTKKYEQVIQKIYALAVAKGLRNVIVRDADLDRYAASPEFEESSEPKKLLDEFADETFWHELTFRFTERDLEREIGGYEKMQTLAPETRFDLETPIEERYLEEFEQYGIERLEVVEAFGASGLPPRTSD